MAVNEIKEGATNPKLPYIGEIGGIAALVAVFVGLLLMRLLEPIADNAADSISQQVADLTGFNPQTGETNSGSQAPLGGA